MKVKEHSRCPRCAREGRDTAGDNLAVYPDGHKHCFRCGYHISADGDLSFLREQPQEVTPQDLILPLECNVNYTQEQRDWIARYGLDENDLHKHNALNHPRGLLFPLYKEGTLKGYQIRTFDGSKMKYITKGNCRNLYYILPGENSQIILTEDLLSAIILNNYGYTTMPVFGSSIKNRFSGLYKRGYRDVVVWLDPDMHVKVIREILYAHNIKVKVIMSDKDPKDYCFKQASKFLT